MWHVTASINTKTETDLPKAKALPAGASGKPLPDKLKPFKPDDGIKMKEGKFAGQYTTLKSIEATHVKLGGRESEYRVTFKVGDQLVQWHALDSTGAVNFEPTQLKAGKRPRNLTTPEAGKRGEHVAGEVGVSPDYLEPKQDPDGYDILAPPRWDRAHLLDGKLDGPGERWNLAMVPKDVNQELHRQYEKTLKANAPKGWRYHIDVRVHYREPEEQPDREKALRAQNKNFDVTRFPKGIDVAYKPVEPPATESGAFGAAVRMPRPEELKLNP
jgi:hypothetical protein